MGMEVLGSEQLKNRGEVTGTALVKGLDLINILVESRRNGNRPIPSKDA